MERIAERLEEEKNKHIGEVEAFGYSEQGLALNKAIEIVKAGGKDE